MTTHAGKKIDMKRSWMILVAVAAVMLLGAGAAVAEAQAAKVLIYSGTTGYRHADAIDNGHGAIENRLTNNPADKGGPIEWDYVTCNGGACPSVNAPVFTSENLAQYDALFFFNTSSGSPALWNAEQRAAIIEFVRNGGGIAGNHNAVDMGAQSVTWDWWDANNSSSTVGALMNGHAATNINNVATVQVADKNHPSTRMLPDTWGFGDEHYNFKRNVRGSHHVLATLDRSSYNVSNGGGDASFGNLDHPISWCTIRERDEVNPGGRVWLTAMGHFGASYTGSGPGSAQFMDHLIGGIRYAAGLEGNDSDCAATVWENYTRTTLVTDARGPIAVDVAKDGKVYWSELGPAIADTTHGFIKYHDPNGPAGNNNTVIQIPTRADWGNSEKGVLGFSLDPDFENNRHIFVYYSPVQDPGCSGSGARMGKMHVSRFTLNAAGTSAELASEKVILEVPSWIRCNGGGSDGLAGNGPGHVGGASLIFDGQGNLVLGVGDDVTPNDGQAGGFAPMDGRTDSPVRLRYDARGTSANSNDLRGKVLRFKPMADPGDTPGVGSTYTIPAGNMFAPGTPNTRPEIYGMGFRQPFTLGVDPVNPGVIGEAEHGPDGGSNSSTRGPSGIIEWNLMNKPGFYGWPFCTGDQSVPNSYVKYTYPSGPANGRYECNVDPVVNDAPVEHNTGLTNIPGPSIAATVWQKRNNGEGAPPANQNIGGGSANEPWAGPIYRFDSSITTPNKFPAYWDGSWFMGERANNWWREMKIRDDNHEMLRVNEIWPNSIGGGNNNFMIPSRFGPDGALYYGKWTVGCCRAGNSNTQTQIYRIDFTANDQEVDPTEDTTPPVSIHTLTGTLVGENTYGETVNLRLSAGDGIGGSGVAKIEYSTTGASGPWTEYTVGGPGLDFGVGNHTVHYRATDKAEPTPNVEDPPKSVSFSVVADTTAPTVTATIAGNQDENDFYMNSAVVTLTAEDDVTPTGDITIEYRNGTSGAWSEYANPLIYTDPGEHTVQYRATDEAGNVSATGTETFSIVIGCTFDKGDEFDGTGLDMLKWTLHPSTTNLPVGSRPRLNGSGQLLMDVPNGEIHGNSAGNINFIGQPVPTDPDWTVETKFTVAMTGGYQSAGLMIWQSDGNFLTLAMVNNNTSPRTTYFELTSDMPNNNRRISDKQGGPDANNPTTAWVRMERDGDLINGYYSWDGETWNGPMTVATGNPPSNTLATSPRRDSAGSLVGLVAQANSGAPSSWPVASFDYIRFTPDTASGCETEDTTPPVTTASTSPASPDGGDGFFKTAPLVTLNAVDNVSQAATIDTEYRIGTSGAFTEYEGPFPLTTDGDPVTVQFRSTDGSGNTEAIKSATFKVDTTPPTVTPTQTPAGAGPHSGTVQVTLAGTDAVSGLSGIEYRVDDGDWTAYSSAIEVSGDGSHTVEYRGTDNAGNVSAPGQVSFGINSDTSCFLHSDEFDVAPLGVNTRWDFRHETTALSGPSAPQIVDGELVMQTLNGELDGTATGPINFVGRDVPAGDWTITTKVTIEHTGGWQSAGIMLWQSDTNFLKIGFTHDLGTGETFFEQSGDNPPNNTRTIGQHVGVSDSNPNTVLLRAIKTGNTLNSQYSIDDGATWSANMPVSTNGSNLAVNPSRIAPGAKIGLYAAGNFDDAATVAKFDYFRVSPDQPAACPLPDTVAPVTTHEFDPATPDGGGGWYAGGPTVALSATDDVTPDAGISIEYRLGTTGAWIPYTDEFAINQNGNIVLQYRATDASGNVEETKSVAVKVDGAKPVTSHALSPSAPDGDGGAWLPGVELTLNAADSHSGIAKTEYSIDGGYMFSEYDPADKPVLTTAGEYDIQYRSVDVAGNIENLRSFPITVGSGGGTGDDNEPPVTAHAINPATADGSNGWYVSKPVSVTLTATDAGANPSGVDHTEWRIAGESGWNAYSAPVSVTSEGVTTIQYRSVDEAGNTETAKQVTVRIDTEAPAVDAQLHPANPGAGGTYGGPVKFSFNGQDPASGISAIEYRVGGGAFQPYAGGEVSVTSDGSYVVEYRAIDSAGNFSPTKTLLFSIVSGTEVFDPIIPVPVLPMDPPASVQLQVNDPSIKGISYAVEYSRDGGQTWETTSDWAAYTGPLSLTDPGLYHINYRWQLADDTWSSIKTMPVTVKGNPPPVTVLALQASPGSKKIKAGKKFNVRVTVANIGSQVAEGTKVCVKTPKKKLKIKGSSCQTFVPLGVGTTADARFRLVKTKKGKSAKATFTVTSPDAPSRKIKVKVKRK